MRLWHQDLISVLPRQQLLEQHRECCVLRGAGWGCPHATVNYVFTHSPIKLFQYYKKNMQEMENRGYKVSAEWQESTYRGKKEASYSEVEEIPLTIPIYPEHDAFYLEECLVNLRDKGIFL